MKKLKLKILANQKIHCRGIVKTKQKIWLHNKAEALIWTIFDKRHALNVITVGMSIIMSKFVARCKCWRTG